MFFTIPFKPQLQPASFQISILPEKYRQFGSEKQQQVKSRKENTQEKGDVLKVF